MGGWPSKSDLPSVMLHVVIEDGSVQSGQAVQNCAKDEGGAGSEEGEQSHDYPVKEQRKVRVLESY